jgi:hypothetical protein
MKFGSVSRGLTAAFLWACALSGPAPAWAAAGPSITSAEDNVAYAVAAICAPYALDGLERAKLPIGVGFVQPDGHDGLARPNPTGVRVGMAGFVHVTFSQKDGVRSCDVQAKGADPQALRKAALEAVAKRPEAFAPTKSRYLPGAFATEDMLCAAPGSAHPTAFVMLSSPRATERDRIAILFTLNKDPSRNAACDHESVRWNYRTLAEGQEAASPPPAVSPDCKLTLADRAPALGAGTVIDFEDRETSRARIAASEKRLGGQIDPDYRDRLRVVVKLDSGETQVFIAPAQTQIHLRDRVMAQGPARNPALPCNYVPPTIAVGAGG